MAAAPAHLRRLPRRELADGVVVHVAGGFRARLRGLLGCDGLPPGHGLLLTRTRSVHTLGMRFSLDLVWLDAAGRPLRIDAGVAPGRHVRCRGARAVVETAAGDGQAVAAAIAQGGGL